MGYGTNNMSLEMCLIVSYTHPHGGNFNKGNMMVNNWVLRGRSFWTEPVGFWVVSASSLEYFVSHLWDDGAWVDDIEYWMLISLATSWIFHHDGQPPYFSGDFNDPFMVPEGSWTLCSWLFLLTFRPSPSLVLRTNASAINSGKDKKVLMFDALTTQQNTEHTR